MEWGTVGEGLGRWVGAREGGLEVVGVSGGGGADRAITSVSLLIRTHACNLLNGLVPAHWPLRLDCPAGKTLSLFPTKAGSRHSQSKTSPNPKARKKIARHAHLTPHSFGGRGGAIFSISSALDALDLD